MRMRSMFAASAMAALLVLLIARSADAGGWATVELSSTPDDLRPGQTWVVDLTVLQHGRTPLTGIEPAVTISEQAGTRSTRFAAEPTGKPGIYRAQVTFPSAGTWEYSIHDGFTGMHSYPPVMIADAAPAAGEAAATARDGGPTVSALAALAVGLMAAVATAVAQRRVEGRRRVRGTAATAGG